MAGEQEMRPQAAWSQITNVGSDKPWQAFQILFWESFKCLQYKVTGALTDWCLVRERSTTNIQREKLGDNKRGRNKKRKPVEYHKMA